MRGLNFFSILFEGVDFRFYPFLGFGGGDFLFYPFLGFVIFVSILVRGQKKRADCKGVG